MPHVELAAPRFTPSPGMSLSLHIHGQGAGSREGSGRGRAQLRRKSVATDDFSPPWMDTVQRQHSPDLHTLPGETLKLFYPPNPHSTSGKAELHSQLVPPTTVCCLGFPAGEQIPGVKADTTGCGMGVGIAAPSARLLQHCTSGVCNPKGAKSSGKGCKCWLRREKTDR